MIPLATTTIRVERDTAQPHDQREAASWVTVASGVRAHIGGPGGQELVQMGSSEDVTFRLGCDPTDLAHGDRVTDEQTGETYQVSWAKQRIGLGLNHTVADLRQVTDRVSV